MLTLLYILTALAMVAVLFTLIMGATSMKGKDIADRQRSNRWMARRVSAQIIAVGLLTLTLYVRNKSGG